MTEEDYNEQIETKLKRLIGMHLEVTGKERFLSKRTANTQRLRLINRMFPEAYYIHMIRDGRAVINSYLNVDWWDDTAIWWLGKRVSEWKRGGNDPVELAAKHWRTNFEEIQANKGIFKKYMEVRYEDFVREPRIVANQITDFCNIAFPETFEKFVPTSLPNMNYKWKRGLSPEQVAVIETNTSDLLERLGYLSKQPPEMSGPVNAS